MTKMNKTVVVKVGTSSITDEEGKISQKSVAKICHEVSDLKRSGNNVVIVTSGAIAAGLPFLGLTGEKRPQDPSTLQAISAIGQGSLIGIYREELANHQLLAGQVLLAPLDFFVRSQYLHARNTLMTLIDLGVIPVVNENDAIADDEIRFGDNDRIAALVAHLVEADLLVLLTDTSGLFTADPRMDSEASLIEEIIEIDQEMEKYAGGSSSDRGSGGMASKLAAAKIASWSGVRTVIADASRAEILKDACNEVGGIGTVVHPRDTRLNARKLWIAFAVGSNGQIMVDEGARKALQGRASLLPTGVLKSIGDFEIGDAVEIIDEKSKIFAKGIVRQDSKNVRKNAGLNTSQLPEGVSNEVIHTDDLVMLP